MKHSIKIDTSKTINPFSYWVLEGELSAGEYPGNQFSFRPSITIATIVQQINAFRKTGFRSLNTSSRKIGNLFDAGVHTFVDLTEDGERPTYMEHLHKERRRRSKRTDYFRFPITDRNVPDKSTMTDILDLIDSEIDEGKTVYVHCFRGLGRTGIVIGCYLVRNGMTGEEAISHIKNLRTGLAGGFRTSPENKLQENFILEWKEQN